MADSVDPDQTAALSQTRSSLICVDTVCSALLIQIFSINILSQSNIFFWENMKKNARFHQEN